MLSLANRLECKHRLSSPSKLLMLLTYFLKFPFKAVVFGLPVVFWQCPDLEFYFSFLYEVLKTSEKRLPSVRINLSYSFSSLHFLFRVILTLPEQVTCHFRALCLMESAALDPPGVNSCSLNTAGGRGRWCCEGANQSSAVTWREIFWENYHVSVENEK